jgi:secondary thiamine-phosphate synthase enzyme
MEIVQIKTLSRMQFIDITDRVRDALARSRVTDGIAIVYVPHTTAGVTINEAADPSVAEDINTSLSHLIPHKGSYRHSEGNADAHIKASLMGSSVHIIISEGALMLGTWQGVFFCEFDGPRTRRALIKVIST